jgi:hypothetical protein
LNHQNYYKLAKNGGFYINPNIKVTIQKCMNKVLGFIVLFFFATISQGQIKQRIGCKILNAFISDTTIQHLFGDDQQLSDTITIIDSLNLFKPCNLSTMNHKTVIIIPSQESNLNPNPNYRMDINEWKNKILIHMVISMKSFYKLYFFYKPTNAVGYVHYRLKGNTILGVKYNIGQL